ncbi:hypothetical protein M407DRAFT_246058 [Tulasnella calospora MUT 4182]|uniref:Uncharacterized protein n=1 Tax=Tulasnella calospora MUT 4182 TaxID=1051891 RepID=A0A0C3LEB0_9AGAM|nr:hypothetical protein M407DRAFT_246058 [Tulasnella calospora MUT 4182]
MFNSTNNWSRTALTGRIKVISSNLGAGQYICRSVGARNNLKTCDDYDDALRVRIAPGEETVILEGLNANASGMPWVGLAASSADKEFGKNSSEWAALTFTTLPSVYPPLKTADNTSGGVSWTWYLGWDGSLRSVWNDEANSVGYNLSWSVELKTKRVYGVSNRKAYVARYYNNNGNTETPVRLVFEPDMPTK